MEVLMTPARERWRNLGRRTKVAMIGGVLVVGGIANALEPPDEPIPSAPEVTGATALLAVSTGIPDVCSFSSVLTLPNMSFSASIAAR